MATNTSDFFTFSKTAGTAKNLQKPTDGGDNNLWGGYINVDLDTIVGAVNATSDLIADANQNELVDFTATGSAVNHVGITNAATGDGPTIEAKGDDTNIDLNVSGKGTGKLATTSPKITTGINDSNNNELIKVTATGSAVNEITVANASTGNGPTLSATGDDTNIDLNIAGKGTGEIEIASNIAFSNDTDAKIKLPSAGGIYESDGSTQVLTESGGSVTIENATFNGTIGSNARANSIQPESGQSLVLKEDDGNAALTIDTDGHTQIASGKRIETDEVRAQSASGLKLYDDGGSGIFVDDGGDVVIGQSGNEKTFDYASRDLILKRDSASNVNQIRFQNANGTVGTIKTSGSSTSFNTSSDYRLKENLTPLSGAIDRINQLKPSRFNFISDPDITMDGFLAHEVSDIVPEAVSGEKDSVDENGDIEPQGIDQSKLVPLLVASVQELSAKVTALENA